MRGFVHDGKTSEPISGARIHVLGLAHDVFSAKSGDYWRLLPPGEYLVTASANGYTSATQMVSVLSKTGPASILNFTLDLLTASRREPLVIVSGAVSNVTNSSWAAIVSSENSTLSPNTSNAETQALPITEPVTHMPISELISELFSNCPNMIQLSVPPSDTAVVRIPINESSNDPRVRIGLWIDAGVSTPRVLVAFASLLCSMDSPKVPLNVYLAFPFWWDQHAACDLTTSSEGLSSVMPVLESESVALVGTLNIKLSCDACQTEKPPTIFKEAVDRVVFHHVWDAFETATNLSNTSLSCSSSAAHDLYRSESVMPILMACCDAGVADIADEWDPIKSILMKFITLASTGIGGWVRDSAGRALSGAEVCSSPTWCVLTGDDGSFWLLASPGHYQVRVRSTAVVKDEPLQEEAVSVDIPSMSVSNYTQVNTVVHIKLKPKRVLGMSKSTFSFLLSVLFLIILGMVVVCLARCSHQRSQSHTPQAPYKLRPEFLSFTTKQQVAKQRLLSNDESDDDPTLL